MVSRLFRSLRYRIEAGKRNAHHKQFLERSLPGALIASRFPTSTRLWSFGTEETVECQPPRGGLPPVTPNFLKTCVGVHRLPQPYVLEVNHGFVTKLPGGSERKRSFTFCLGPKGTIIRESVVRNSKDYYESLSPRMDTDRLTVLMDESSRPPIDASFEVACPLPSDIPNNYAHWLVEILPRLQAVEHYREVTGQLPLLLLDESAPEWVDGMLNAMGFESETFQRIRGRFFYVERMVIPSWRSSEFLVSPAGWLWTQSRIGTSPTAIKPPSRIYLERRAHEKRLLSNAESVRDFLEQAEFTTLHLEDYTLPEQAYLMSKAEVIVAPTGAALANLLFAPRDVKIFDIFGPMQTNAY